MISKTTLPVETANNPDEQEYNIVLAATGENILVSESQLLELHELINEKVNQ